MAAEQTHPRDQGLVAEDGKNIKAMNCRLCNSKILKPGQSTFEEKELFLPNDRKSSSDPSVNQGSTVSHFWHVRDMFHFENMGFAHTVGDLKYLTCADCEREVLGVQLLSAPGKPIYLACARVKYL